MPKHSPRATAPYDFSVHIAPIGVTDESEALIHMDLGGLT